MKIKEGFLLSHVGGDTVVVATGEASKGFNGIIRLNGTGEVLWTKLVQETSREDLVEIVCQEYGIEETIAARDVDAFLQKLSQADILEN